MDTTTSELAWLNHKTRWHQCCRCSLGSLAEHHVLGRGPIPSHTLVLGSSPGDAENKSGFALHGHSGRILKRLFTEAGWKKSVFVSNLLACRPVDTEDSGMYLRTGTREEIDACRPRVKELFDIVHPKISVFISQLTESEWSETCPIPFISLPSVTQILRDGGKNSSMFHVTVTEMREFSYSLDMEEKP